MTDDDDVTYKVYAEFFKVFSSPRRLKIISVISTEWHNVGEIAEQTGLSSQVVSQNLANLMAKGAVASRKEGRYTYYHCANKKFCDGVTMIKTGIEEVVHTKNTDLTSGSPSFGDDPVSEGSDE